MTARKDLGQSEHVICAVRPHGLGDKCTTVCLGVVMTNDIVER